MTTIDKLHNNVDDLFDSLFEVHFRDNAFLIPKEVIYYEKINGKRIPESDYSVFNRYNFGNNRVVRCNDNVAFNDAPNYTRTFMSIPWLAVYHSDNVNGILANPLRDSLTMFTIIQNHFKYTIDLIKEDINVKILAPMGDYIMLDNYAKYLWVMASNYLKDERNMSYINNNNSLIYKLLQGAHISGLEQMKNAQYQSMMPGLKDAKWGIL